MSNRLADHSGVYSTQKIAWHPEALENLRQGKITAPIITQLMWTNTCQQACNFCSYGSGPPSVRAKIQNPDKKLWKNQQLFEGRDIIPLEKVQETLSDLSDMGTKCVEVTGGGEPLTYPWLEEGLEAIKQSGLEFALVTNGERLSERLADQIADLYFAWCRVSIDAGTVEEYTRIRNVSPTHWGKAWAAVKLLSARKKHPEAIVGVGMVVDRDNWQGIYECCRLAFDANADNVRISAAFTPEGPKRFSAEVLSGVPILIERAKRDFECSTFKIHDLFEERKHNVDYAHQTYPYCYWKEIGCVIGADQNVYACCSWAYNKMGLMGSIREQSFRQMWEGDGWKWRQAHDPRKDCRIHCLYERRNLEALQLMGDQGYANDLSKQAPPPHRNFI